MTRQRRAEKPLVCANGEHWLGTHPLCRAELARVCGVAIEDVILPDLSRYAAPIEIQQGEFF